MEIFRGFLRVCAVGFAFAASALGTSCGESQGADAASRPGPPPVTVEVARVEPELLRDVESFGGQLLAEYSVVLKPEIEGVVASIDFEEGQRVKKGDVLVHLRDDEQRARLAEAEANLELARQENARATQLVHHNAASQAQKDRSGAELSVAKSRVDLARLQLDRTQIRAPFDGVVGMRLVSIGARVSEETHLVQLDAVDRLQLIFPASEQAVAFARVGTPISIQVAPYPGETFPGKVFFVAPTVDPETRRVYIKAWVPNPDGRLRAGLYANLDMEIARHENALVIPESAVVYDRHGTYVWRVGAKDLAERVPVELGLRKGGRVEVTLGLNPGAEIVVAGTHKVTAGGAIVRGEPATTGQAYRTPDDRKQTGEGT